MNYQKFLPIGTVVLLKEGTKKAMITGFCVTPEDGDGKMYDYCGCLYPEGVLSSKQTLLFNHEQIAQIFHLGFSDEEDKQFKQKLTSMIETINKIK